MSLRGKAEPMLPGEANGRSFINDRVLSIPLTSSCGGRSSATLIVKCERQGRFTLLDDLRLQRDIKAHWAVHQQQVFYCLPDGASSVTNVLTTLTSTQRFAQQQMGRVIAKRIMLEVLRGSDKLVSN